MTSTGAAGVELCVVADIGAVGKEAIIATGDADLQSHNEFSREVTAAIVTLAMAAVEAVGEGGILAKIWVASSTLPSILALLLVKVPESLWC